VPPEHPHLSPTQSAALRELFWQNVIREILTSLSIVSAQRLAALERGRNEPVPGESPGETLAAPPPGPPDDARALFDGRMAVILKTGERVPIGEVFPIFACGIDTPLERALSVALECTVFQVRTPRGQVYTIPLQEVRAFHALSPELMRTLEQAARDHQHGRRGGALSEQVPFGFAAFTSLVRGGGGFLEPAPEHPME
jgi:hypothetical protein